MFTGQKAHSPLTLAAEAGADGNGPRGCLPGLAMGGVHLVVPASILGTREQSLCANTGSCGRSPSVMETDVFLNHSLSSHVGTHRLGQIWANTVVSA